MSTASSSSFSSQQSPPNMASITDVSALFKTAKKYEELNVIGTGAYGTVYKARDLHNGQIVAMKKVKVALTDDGIPLSTLREIALLRQLEAYRHPNIVRLLDVGHGRGPLEREKQLVLFLVFEHVQQDLDSFLKRTPSPPLGERSIREMSRDILSGVDFLHSHRIVHRDLKPHNLLVTSSGRVKLADFGLAKTYDPEMKLTTVVVTLWYRPPEVLLGTSYNTAVDVWSSGCVLAQLHTISPLLPGASDTDQLHCIFRLIGRPPRNEWPTNASIVVDAFPDYPPQDLADLLPRVHPHALDLIKFTLFEPLTKSEF